MNNACGTSYLPGDTPKKGTIPITREQRCLHTSEYAWVWTSLQNRKASIYQSSQIAFVLGGLLQHGKSSLRNGWIVAVYLRHQHLDAPLLRLSVIRSCATSAGCGRCRISQPTVRHAGAPQRSSHPVQRKQPELAVVRRAGDGFGNGVRVACLVGEK